MRKIAIEGYPPGKNLLEPQQCLEVVQFIVDEAARINRSLDLRLSGQFLRGSSAGRRLRGWTELAGSCGKPGLRAGVNHRPNRDLRNAGSKEITTAGNCARDSWDQRGRTLPGLAGANGRCQPGEHVPATRRASPGRCHAVRELRQLRKLRLATTTHTDDRYQRGQTQSLVDGEATRRALRDQPAERVRCDRGRRPWCPSVWSGTWWDQDRRC